MGERGRAELLLEAGAMRGERDAARPGIEDAPRDVVPIGRAGDVLVADVVDRHRHRWDRPAGIDELVAALLPQLPATAVAERDILPADLDHGMGRRTVAGGLEINDANDMSGTGHAAMWAVHAPRASPCAAAPITATMAPEPIGGRHMMIRSLLLAGAALALAAPPATAQKASGAKAEVVKGVDARAKLGQQINDLLFSFAELGFQEVETARYLTALLEKEGFTVERGVSGLPTAWFATWSNGGGGPTIAIGSDVDGIPKASQYPGIPWHKPMVEGGPGHGEGHNSGNAVNILAALAVKDWMTRTGTKGTLVLWPGVAEELLGAKAWYVRDGRFKDVDAAIFSHVYSELKTFWGHPSGTGLVSVKYEFKGESAHAAGLPWRGRSALDAAMLMGVGWDMRREHLRPQTRSHYIFPEAGDQPNVVPQAASVWFYFREMDFKRIKDLWKVGDDMAEGAAKMTNTSFTRRILGTAAPGHFNKPLADALDANIKAVGMPKWDADDQAFAKAVQTMLGNEKVEGLKTAVGENTPPPKDEDRESGGSDDIGDVSWTVPTVELYYPSNIPGMPGHNWANGIAMATPIAHKGIVVGAKAMAMTLVDILTKPALLAAAKDYYSNVQTKDAKYVPMLSATDKPPVEMNAGTMARFKPELSKFYYQPDKYPTYLEQLGVKWPTLAKPAGEK